MEKTIWAETAFVGKEWLNAVRVDIDARGFISLVEADHEPFGFKVDVLLPAPVNGHSHSFQRAIAGLTEVKSGQAEDSFWTWRRQMYRFLSVLDPDDIEAIAAFVQMEMLEAGFAAVCEFHYLHHGPDGRPYNRQAEMAARIASAAYQTGIGLTLLPVYYRFAGCDRSPLTGAQLRFASDPDKFPDLLNETRSILKTFHDDSILGVAAHSLRAVPIEDLVWLHKLEPDAPFHLHAAEQTAEVEEVFAYFGKRPVDIVLDSLPVDDRFCIIHATHMNEKETIRLASSGAVAGLCPITEANLADGFFNASSWLRLGGRFCIGSDSHILISLQEELRTLEYGQRLKSGKRVVMAEPGKSAGRLLFEKALEGGAYASGRRSGRIERGYCADLLTLGLREFGFAHSSNDRILDSFVFAGSNSMVKDVFVKGRHIVHCGKHCKHNTILERYQATMAKLVEKL